MKFVTWNVNSLRMRMPRVLEFLKKHAPDVVCLQETKVTPIQFPHAEFEAEGYRAADFSGGRWAGVAVLTRDPLTPSGVVKNLPEGESIDPEARWIEVDVGGIRTVSVYVINGRTPDDPMYTSKMTFLEHMESRLGELVSKPLVVMGDFNIAPSDLDVWDPQAFEGATHVTPQERARLQAILDRGMVDAYRHLESKEPGFTWWDYRQGHFHRGRGMRIDLALVSQDLAPRITSCGIDRNFRKGPKPSDHAPLLLELSETE